MKAMLGEEGTEQFTVETRVDGIGERMVRVRPIHDPFIRNTTVISPTRWALFRAIFRPHTIRVEVTVRANEGAERAIMALDPEQLRQDTEEILEQRRISRESTPTCLYAAEGSQVRNSQDS